uniref:Vacuolar protein sorting-associated protein 26 n=1 Tax=Nyssomyia neivai TaxID=330878 RepID=A0A1L8DVC7_9DIPT
MNFLGFGQSADLDIVFDGADSRKMAEIKTEDGKKEKYLLYYDGETVSGKVNVTLKKPGSKLEHQGIKIELIGQIELYYDRGNHHEFLSLVKELARPGDLIQNSSYPFEFANVEKPYEVYVGSNVRLRYFLRATVVRRLSDIIREVDIAVHTLCSYPEVNSPIKMEVGIEDCLHIEFEYNKSKYHLKDVIVGKIYFLLVRIKIKHMEIAIIKRETTGSGPNTFTENETIAKYEIMDGAPVRGESIPIRVFLAGYDLTPAMRDINKKFSVKYFLNLVLMDTEDRRYFKQQEITLWRKAEKSRKSSSVAQNPHVPSHLVGSDGDMISKSHQNDGNQHLDTSPAPPMDPTVGLFTQESPQNETKPLESPTFPGENDNSESAQSTNDLPLPLDSPDSTEQNP